MSASQFVHAVLAVTLLFSAVAEAQPAKKKAEPREGPAGDRDGKDNVRGAVWEVTATRVEPADKGAGDKPNASEKKSKRKASKDEPMPKREVFRFRHQSGVVFNIEGDKIGAVTPISADPKEGIKSRLTLDKSTPLIGEMVMTQSKVGVWGGVFKTKTGEEWRCAIKVLDR